MKLGRVDADGSPGKYHPALLRTALVAHTHQIGQSVLQIS